MIFPDAPRVIYEPNPLVEVLTQLRFPPILKIETDLPSRFQDLIRSEYPQYKPREESILEGVPEQIRPLVDKVLGGMVPSAQAAGHQFISADEEYRVALSRNFIALTTTKYRRWEDFRPRILRLTDALQEAYQPAAFSRVGLRYKDLVTRSTLGLAHVPWRELLSPHLTGELASPDIPEHLVVDARRVIRLKDPGSTLHVTLQHGLVVQEERGEAGEFSYLVDADFFSEERMDGEQALGFLDGAHREAGLLWRWCISDRLHNSLSPQAP